MKRKLIVSIFLSKKLKNKTTEKFYKKLCKEKKLKKLESTWEDTFLKHDDNKTYFKLLGDYVVQFKKEPVKL